MKLTRFLAPLVALAALMLTFTPATAADWNISSATDVFYLVQEMEPDAPGDEIDRTHQLAFAEGVNFQHLGFPVGLTIGIALLDDEEAGVPRAALAGLFNLGTEKVRWSIGALRDFQNAEEEWRAVTGISFSPEELIGP